MTVLYVQNNLIQRFVALCTAQFFPHVFAIEHAGDLPEQFQVCIGGRFWHQQYEQQVDRRAIDGVEIYRGVKVEQGAHRRLAALEATVGDSNAVTKTG